MQRNILILAAVTLVAVIAAVVVLMVENESNRPPERSALFPGIEEEFDRLTRLEIADKSGKVTVARADDGGWVLPEKDGYPADRSLVRRTLLAFSRMEVIEPKTKQPELYERLGLRDLSAGDSRSRVVTLFGPEDQTIAALIIGDRAGGAVPGGTSSGVDRAYVRKAGEAQTWLVDGVPELEAQLSSWFDDELVTIARERIKEIAVRHADGEAVRMARATAEEQDFTVSDTPEGRELKSYGGPSSIASSFSFLTFDDVRPVPAELGQPNAVTTVTTFDGLVLTVSLHDGWAHFNAGFSAAEGATPAVAVTTPGDGKAEAAAINARLGSWLYKLPEYKAEDLRPRLDDLLEPEAQEKS